MSRGKKSRALPRRERTFPQTDRVFSTNFPDQLLSHPNRCFVPVEDYRKLERKYLALFNRYIRTRYKMQQWARNSTVKTDSYECKTCKANDARTEENLQYYIGKKL